MGRRVPAGRSSNVVAHRPGGPVAAHLVVGAHLDTVPQAPGAEDNASGVGVLLAVAEAVAERRTRLPVVLVASGRGAPRGGRRPAPTSGPGPTSTPSARPRGARCGGWCRSTGSGWVTWSRWGRQRAPIPSSARCWRRRGVPGSRPSPRPSSAAATTGRFVRAGLPAARLGSTPYAGYHSARDAPAVVSARQLTRTGRVVLAWLAPSPRFEAGPRTIGAPPARRRLRPPPRRAPGGGRAVDADPARPPP